MALAVWLLAYFGPLGYSLNRHGSLVVLAIFPIAAVMAVGGFSTFFSKPALLLKSKDLPDQFCSQVLFFSRIGIGNLSSDHLFFPVFNRCP